MKIKNRTQQVQLRVQRLTETMRRMAGARHAPRLPLTSFPGSLLCSLLCSLLGSLNK